MVTPDPDRLRRLLGGEDVAWIVERARARLESGRPLTGRITLRGASTSQQQAAARLLGRPPGVGGAVSVRLEEVDDVLRRSGADPDGLASAVVALSGPVVDRAAERAAEDRAWAAVFGRLDAAVADRPQLAAWAAGLRRTGSLRRVSSDADDAARLVTDLATVLGELPADDEPVGVFARRTVGAAHALDEDRRVARLLLGAVAVLAGMPDGEGAAWRREAWSRVGVLRDDLSSTTLVLGLPGDDITVTGRVLAACARSGQPCVLTLRQLAQDPPRLEVADRTVSVCEGPVVVSLAANRLGARCAPLVCVGGQPGVATMRLLRLLVEAGAHLRYHGDFDWGGVRIGNALFDRLPVEPWRFDAAAYREASGSALGAPLRGRSVAASWDAELAPTMSAIGRQVEEEGVIDALLSDLAR